MRLPSLRRPWLAPLLAGGWWAAAPCAATEFVKYIDTVKEGKRYPFQVNLVVHRGQAKTVDLYVDGQHSQRLATVGANAVSGSYTLNRSIAPLPLGPHTLVLRDCFPAAGTCSDGPPQPLEVLKDAAARFGTTMTAWDQRKANPAQFGVGPRFRQTGGRTVGAYYAEWRASAFLPKQVPAENLTHLYYAFLVPCGSFDATEQVANDPDPLLAPATRKQAAEAFKAGRAACAGRAPGEIAIFDTATAFDRVYNEYNEDDPYVGVFSELYRLKRAFPHVRILASIGGWSFSDPFFEFAPTAAGRLRFAASVANFLERYDVFDGVDVDWEYPGKGGLTERYQGTPSNALHNRYLLRTTRIWLDELGRRNGRRYELTVAAGASPDHMSRADWRAAHPSLDRINLLTYDFYGAWNETYGSQAALYSGGCPTTPDADLSADAAVRYLTSRGVPAAKLGIGLTTAFRGWQGIQNGDSSGPFNGLARKGAPIDHTTHPTIPAAREQDWGVVASRNIFAGYWWSGAPMPPGWGGNRMFFELTSGGGWGGLPLSSPVGLNGYQVFTDACAGAQYLWRHGTGTLIVGDTAYSAHLKSRYAADRGLGGVFLWEVSDDPGYLLPYANRGIGNPSY